jgi:hypothetical protein
MLGAVIKFCIITPKSPKKNKLTARKMPIYTNKHTPSSYTEETRIKTTKTSNPTKETSNPTKNTSIFGA